MEYQVKASAKMQRVAPRKARLVLDLIRNKNVAEAINIVSNTDKKASKIIFKLLNSAVANAEFLNDEKDANINIDNLYVRLAYANEGPTLKRIRPRAQGRASAINKRTSHITIVLDERKGAKDMGQKVNPNGFRVGVIRDWESNWYTDHDYAKFVDQDEKIRKFLSKKLKDAFVSKIKIERSKNQIRINIVTARPGVVLGQNGENIKELEKRISRIVDKGTKIIIDVTEVENVDLDAQVVADMIARQLENRANFRIAQKKAIRNVMKAGAKGIKTKISGRLGGVEMARSEGYTEGNVPLQTIRADIDYALGEALTTYGLLGVKVWIYKGEVLPTKESK